MFCVQAATVRVPEADEAHRLAVTVLFTDIPNTLTALRHAAFIARRIEAWVRILVPVVVPYTLDLASSPVNEQFVCRELTTAAQESDIPAVIEVVHCRSREQAVENSLGAESVLIVCSRKWWPFDGVTGLARRLARQGHTVVDVRSE